MNPQSHPHILIVDDQESIRQLLQVLFKRQSFTVTLAQDGQEGVEAARSQMPDVIIMDIHMPRKNGLQAVQEMRADPRLASIPIIALTANLDLPEELIRRGFTRVLAKPTDFATLLQTVFDVLPAGNSRTV